MNPSILSRIVGSGGGAGATDGTAGPAAAVREPVAGRAGDGTDARALDAGGGALVTDPVVAGLVEAVRLSVLQPEASSPVPSSIADTAAP
jgi:hypothetical protein